MSLLDDLKRLVSPPSKFPHTERDLSTVYGLPVEALKKIRTQLRRGADWDLVKGLVSYSIEGRAALERLLQLPPSTPPATTPEVLVGPDSATNITPPPAEEPPPDLPDPDDEDEQPPAKKYVEPAVGEERTLVCVATVHNRRQVRARDEDRAVWVRVKENKNFRAGMEMPSRYLGGDKWELIGRCPRWPGKY